MRTPTPSTSSLNAEYNETDRLLETPYADRPRSSYYLSFMFKLIIFHLNNE